MDKQNLWNNVMDMAMRLPGVQVDRERFLRDTLHRFCTRQQLDRAVRERPDVVLREDVLQEIAASVINHHVLQVTTISAAAGLPGGWGAWVALPADLGQYYWHCFVVAQKLAYLYGYPDLKRVDGELARNLTIFVGVMMGVAKANEAINALARKVVTSTVEKMANDTLQRAAWFQVVHGDNRLEAHPRGGCGHLGRLLVPDVQARGQPPESSAAAEHGILPDCRPHRGG